MFQGLCLFKGVRLFRTLEYSVPGIFCLLFAFEIHFGSSQTFLKLSCWNLLQKQLHNYIFYISLAAIEVDLPKAVNACINHSWAYNGRRASPYLTWRTPPFLKLDRKSPPFSMELWPPKCRLIFFFSFRRQKYQPHYILMEFVCLAHGL